MPPLADHYQAFSIAVVTLTVGGMLLVGSVLVMSVLELAGKLTERESVSMLYRMALGGSLLVLGAFATIAA